MARAADAAEVARLQKVTFFVGSLSASKSAKAPPRAVAAHDPHAQNPRPQIR